MIFSRASDSTKQGTSWQVAGDGFSRVASWTVLVMYGVLTGWVSGCASGSAPSRDSAAQAGAPAYSNDVLRAGDVISITCESVTNINTVAKIPLNGKLDLLFVGPVQAAGKTAEQLQDDLIRLYSKQVRADVITVKLVQSSAAVYVVGAVRQPGKIPMDRPMTVLDAVMEAGGYDPSRARLSKVAVVRLEDGRQKTYRVNLAEVLDGKDSTPFFLKPFDTVEVPQRMINW